MKVTPIYAAVLALLFVYLSVRTIRLRQRLRVAVGDGGKAELQRASRVHGNFAEYVPLALLLIFFIETEVYSGPMIHILGAALLVGRILHAYGVSHVEENLSFRVSGVVLTFAVIIIAALVLLARALRIIGT
jgi:uncharacterized membrane protein YecN with MAPEG domain